MDSVRFVRIELDSVRFATIHKNQKVKSVVCMLRQVILFHGRKQLVTTSVFSSKWFSDGKEKIKSELDEKSEKSVTHDSFEKNVQNESEKKGLLPKINMEKLKAAATPEKIKEKVRDVTISFFICNTLVSCVSIGTLYIAVSSGVDMESLFKFLREYVSFLPVQQFDPTFGKWAIILAAHLATGIIRHPIALMLANPMIPVFKRWGRTFHWIK